MDQAQSNVQEQPQGLDSTTPESDRDYRASEQFRAICEARYVLAKPLAERRQYLDDVGKVRGAAARKYLERVIRSEWEKRKAPEGAKPKNALRLGKEK